jgi:hypothetical protein
MRTTKALGAFVVLLGVVLIPPLLLMTFVGSPIPRPLGLRTTLSDADLIKLVSLAAWALWLQTVWCIGYEVHTAMTTKPMDGAWGTFSMQQHAARVLIGAVLATFAAGPAFAVPPRDTGLIVRAPADPISRPDVPPAADPPVRTQLVTVAHGDSLWSLAQEHLGSGERWHEIAALNEGRQMPNGAIFRSSEAIRPGWDLRVQPTSDTAASVEHPADVVVKAGDTLSAIALDGLGDASRWPEVFESSRHLDQPRPMVDPNLIYPGQLVDLPDPEPHAPADNAAPEAAPPTTAQPAPRPTQETESKAVDVEPSDKPDRFSWVLPSMLGAGTFLAGAVLILLRQRRATQSRFRRPGRVLPKPDPWANTVERSITAVGRSTVADVEWLDDTLRRLAGSFELSKEPMPRLNAARLGDDGLTLLLDAGSLLSTPWTSNADSNEWHLPKDAAPDEIGPPPGDRLSPWPLLTAAGVNDGEVVLINLEDRAVSVTGDPERAANLARFIAAEVTCNPWSRLTKLDLVGLATEVEAMRPEWTRIHDSPEHVTGEALSEAIHTIDRLAPYGVDSPTARAHQRDEDVWPSRLLMVDGSLLPTTELVELIGLFRTHSGRTGTAVVTNAHLNDALNLDVTADGRLTIPFLDGSVEAATLSSREAEGCAALLAHTEGLHDAEPEVFEDEEGWRKFASTTGALRPEIEMDVVGEASADTASDVRRQVEESDPNLIRDLADWFSDSCHRPKVSVLGPVEVRATGVKPRNRHAFYAELATYLALHPSGVKPATAADELGISPERLPVDMNAVRAWLGTDPTSAQPYFPQARYTDATAQRGERMYQASGLLIDSDLFLRLKVRGEARGPDGTGDLLAALSLVRGKPFSELREAGWSWLLDLHPHQYLNLEAAIADLGHALTSQALEMGDVTLAREAVTAAMLGAQEDEILRVDFAAVLSATGADPEAERFLREMVFNRSDDGGPPLDLPDRTREAVARMRSQSKAAI